MRNSIGLRLEDKNPWERRVALVPEDVRALVARGLDIRVERFPERAFPDEAYSEAGAALVDDVSGCDLVLGIKEMPEAFFGPGGAYAFFSHTIKGQPYNMEMLASLVENRCTLIDYETVTDEEGRRLIFFGRYAGVAGMIDTLWALGRRLEALGHENVLAELEPAHRYEDLEAAVAAVAEVGLGIASEGLPGFMAPAVIGITGYGNVSQGAQEILDLLPHEEVAPGDLASFVAANRDLTDRVAKVVYREEHLVEPKDPSRAFDLRDYYARGEAYRSRFGPHLELLTVLVNGIYWDERYPRLADAGQLAGLFSGDEPPRLLAVGDITCDVDGSLACTVRDTHPGDPCYVYDPATREAPSGFEGPGISVMAVGNLPCELPREASRTFSEALVPFMPALSSADLGAAFDEADIPAPIRRATILWRGDFTPGYEHMKGYLR